MKDILKIVLAFSVIGVFALVTRDVAKLAQQFSDGKLSASLTSLAARAPQPKPSQVSVVSTPKPRARLKYQGDISLGANLPEMFFGNIWRATQKVIEKF